MRALAAVIAALALAPAAQAATPVTGSGSLNDAPVLEPGEYSDTILPGEQLFYAVRLEEGQRLALAARTSLDTNTFRDLVALLRFRPLGPLREPLEPDGEDDIGEVHQEARWEVGPAQEATSDPYLGPGTWYFYVHAFWGSPDAPPKAEIPFTFAVEVAGAEGSGGTPTPTPTATPAATPAPAPEPRKVVDDAVDPAAIGAVGMSGLLLGLIGGALAGRRRRR